MTNEDDALASVVAAVRGVSVPRARLVETARAEAAWDARRARDAERREVHALRARLGALAPAADAWLARWIRAGRLDLVLAARPDLRPTHVALPRLRVTGEGGARWQHEAQDLGHGTHRWYDFALGRTHAIRGGVSGIRLVGGVGGELGTVRTLAELAQRAWRSPRPPTWDGLEADVLRVGIRVAELLREGGLEPLLVASLARDAVHLASVIELEQAERAMLRDEPGGEQRYREAVERQGLTSAVVTADMLVHVARRTGLSSTGLSGTGPSSTGPSSTGPSLRRR